MRKHNLSPQIGFTLLEVLISLLIFSFILLGTDAMHIVALRKARIAYYYQCAAQQIKNMEERLRVLINHDGQAEQISLWDKENKRILPQGRGEVHGFYPSYVITIYWGAAPPKDCRQVNIGLSGCLSRQVLL